MTAGIFFGGPVVWIGGGVLAAGLATNVGGDMICSNIIDNEFKRAQSIYEADHKKATAF